MNQVALYDPFHFLPIVNDAVTRGQMFVTMEINFDFIKKQCQEEIVNIVCDSRC